MTYTSFISSASLRKISTLVMVLPDDTITPLNKRTHNVRRRSHTNEGGGTGPTHNIIVPQLIRTLVNTTPDLQVIPIQSITIRHIQTLVTKNFNSTILKLP